MNILINQLNGFTTCPKCKTGCCVQSGNTVIYHEQVIIKRHIITCICGYYYKKELSYLDENNNPIYTEIFD